MIINGISMEPGYHRGDLVITRTAESYHVGDIVTYRQPDIGPVIHRIVEQKDDQFVLQGDNNSWLDSYHPTESEIIGKAFIHIPSMGKLFEWMRSPMGLAVMVIVVGGMGLMTFETAREEDKQPHQEAWRIRWRRALAAVHKQGNVFPGGSGSPGGSSSPGGDGGPPGRAAAPGKNAQGVINLLVVAMLMSLLLGGFAFTRSTSSIVSEDLAYEHEGEFKYSAVVPAGVYDTTKVRTGEPVFMQLTKNVQVQFHYQFTTEVPTDSVEGTHRLVAQVSDTNGWKRKTILQPDTRFTGDGFTVHADLDLSPIRKDIKQLEMQTGYSNNRYTVSVVPEVSTGGALAGKELDDEFSPRLDFWMDKTQLQLQNPNAAAASGNASEEKEGADQLEPSESGSVEIPKTVANSISILGIKVGVGTARLLSLLGLALCVGGLVWFGLPMLRARKAAEPARIRSQYGDLLVSMNGGDLDSGGRVIEVAAFEDLVKIAEKSGQSILHQTSDGSEHYYVQDIGVSYHYWAPDQEKGTSD